MPDFFESARPSDGQMRQEESVSGPPRIQNQARGPLSYRDRYTVAYFMPDGDIIIRYEYADSGNPIGHTFMGQQAFMVVRSIPGKNGASPSVEVLKVRGDIRPVLESIVLAHLSTDEVTEEIITETVARVKRNQGESSD